MAVRLRDPAAVSAFADSVVKILEGGAEGGKVGEGCREKGGGGGGARWVREDLRKDKGGVRGQGRLVMAAYILGIIGGGSYISPSSHQES